MQKKYSRAGRANRSGGFDEFQRLHLQDLAPRQPRISSQTDNTQCENQAINPRSQKRHQCDGEEYPRKRHQGINNDHRHKGVDNTTHVSGESSDENANYPGEQYNRCPYPHADAGPQQDAGKDITAQLIVTKRMIPGGPSQPSRQILYGRIVGQNPGAEQCDQSQSRDDYEPHECEFVFPEEVSHSVSEGRRGNRPRPSAD